MLVNKYRAAIERTYIDRCIVIEYVKEKQLNGSTALSGVTAYTDIPCRLSFVSKSAAVGTETVTNTAQTIKLFLSPDIEIKAGAKITVSHDGRTTEYKSSGFPAVYRTHQEIPLVLFDERA